MKAYVLTDMMTRTPTHTLLVKNHIKREDIRKVIEKSLKKRNEDEMKTKNADSESWYIEKGLKEAFKEDVEILDFSEMRW